MTTYVPALDQRVDAIHTVLRKRCYTATTKNVAAYFLTCQNSGNGRCDPSYETAAAALGIDRRSVMRAVKEIEAEGDLAVEVNGGLWRSNQYNFAFMKLAAELEVMREEDRLRRAKDKISSSDGDSAVTIDTSDGDSAVTPIVTAGSPSMVTVQSPKHRKKNTKKVTQESLFRNELADKADPLGHEAWARTVWCPEYPSDEWDFEVAVKSIVKLLQKREATRDELLAAVKSYANTDRVWKGFIFNPSNFIKHGHWKVVRGGRVGQAPHLSPQVDAILAYGYGAPKREASG